MANDEKILIQRVTLSGKRRDGTEYDFDFYSKPGHILMSREFMLKANKNDINVTLHEPELVRAGRIWEVNV